MKSKRMKCLSERILSHLRLHKNNSNVLRFLGYLVCFCLLFSSFASLLLCASRVLLVNELRQPDTEDGHCALEHHRILANDKKS